MKRPLVVVLALSGLLAAVTASTPFRLGPQHGATTFQAHSGGGSRKILQADGTFLGSLPLRVVTTIPESLGSSAESSPQGADALQVVFTRPVLALGQDFGEEEPSVVPFTLNPAVGGKGRWVTTYIYRFDPASTWKTDLDVELTWNRTLTSWDGVPLVTEGLTDGRLVTPPLSMRLQTVTSEAASAATDGQWSPTWFSADAASAGTAGSWVEVTAPSVSSSRTSAPEPVPQSNDSPLHEVPADGIVELYFDAPVSVPLVRAALQLKPGTLDAVAADLPAMTVEACSKPPGVIPVEPVALDDAAAAATADPGPLVNLVCVSFDKSLTEGERYTLVLPVGTSYDPEAGTLKTAVQVTVQGLYPFIIPFLDDYITPGEFRSETRYKRLRVALPHGHSESTTPAVFKEQVELFQRVGKAAAQAVEYEAEFIDRATVELFVDSLQPDVEYEIRITATADTGAAREGVYSNETFGQPLTVIGDRDPMSVSIKTAALGPRFIAPTNDYNYQGGQFVLAAQEATELEWPVITRGKFDYTFENSVDFVSVTAVPVAAVAAEDGTAGGLDLEAALKRWIQEPYQKSLLSDKTPGLQSVELEDHTNEVDTPQLHDLNVRDALAGSGLVLLETVTRDSCYNGAENDKCTPCPGPDPGRNPGRDCYTQLSSGWSTSMLSSTDLSVVIVGWADGVTVWATSNVDGTPVADVEFTLYSVSPYPSSNPGAASNFQSFETVVTGATGEATLPITKDIASDNQSNVFAAVFRTPEGKLLAHKLGDVYSWGLQARTTSPVRTGELILDRAVFTPGETVYVKGYVRSLSPQEGIALADAANYTLHIGSWQDDSGPDEVVSVEIDPTFGTFDRTIEIPGDARLSGSVQVTLRQGGEQLASAAVTVADPRPPTAELTMEAPAWVKADAMLSASIKAVSFIGASVADAPMTLAWSVGAAQGTISVITEADGMVTATLDLAAVEPAPNVTQTVQLDLEWVGPTRERIMATDSVLLAASEYYIKLDTSVPDAVPQQTFAVLAALYQRGDVDTPVDSAAIQVSARRVPEAASDTDELDEYNDYDDYGFSRGVPGPSPPPSPPSKVYQVDPSSDLGEPVCEIVPPVAGVTPAWDARWEDCRWAVPDVGAYTYEIVACAEVDATRVCFATQYGRTGTEWAMRPVTALPGVTTTWAVPQGADGFAVGTDATLYVEALPGKDVVSARMLWYSSGASGSVAVPDIAPGLNEVKLAVPAECTSGCSTTLMLAYPQQPFTLTATQPDLFPVSLLTDLTSPMIRTSESRLPVTGSTPQLRLAIDTSAAAVAAEDAAAEPVYVQPGAAREITIELLLCPDGVSTQGDGMNCVKPEDDVEVTLFAVDKAWLQLLPYQLADLVAAFKRDWAPALSTGNTLEALVATSALDNLKKLVLRRLALEPWGTPRLALADFDFADTTDADYLRQLFTYLSPTGPGFFPGEFSDSDSFGGPLVALAASPVQRAAAAEPEAMADDAAALSGSSESSGPDEQSAGDGADSGGARAMVRSDDDFVTTPLFEVQRSANGSALAFTFQAPPNLGTFELRAYAASAGGAVFGSAHGEVVVRRELSLTGAVPRMVRVGDEFEAGVIVTLSAPAVGPVFAIVDLALEGDVTLLEGAESKEVAFAAGEVTRELRFRLKASAVGGATLTFTAGDGAGASDALELSLPVRGLQTPVHIASSFAVRGDDSTDGMSEWKEGLALPAAEAGTGTVELIAGVGKLPAVQASVASLLTLTPTEPRRIYAPWALATLITRPALLQYGPEALDITVTVPPTQAIWLKSLYPVPVPEPAPQDVDLEPATAAELERAVANLGVGKLTDASLGLTYSGRQSYNNRPDVYLNLYGAWVVARMNRLIVSMSTGTSPGLEAAASTVTALATGWIEVGTRELVRQAVEARDPTKRKNPGPYYSLGNIILLRLAQPDGWNPDSLLNELIPTSTEDVVARRSEVREDLGLDRLYTALPEMRIDDTAMLLLLLNQLGAASDADEAAANATAAAVKQLTARFRITARTAYLSYAEGQASPASKSSQSKALLALTEHDTLTAGPAEFAVLTEKLANYISGTTGGSGAFNTYPSASGSVSDILALTVYDVSKDSNTPDLELAVRSDTTVLLSADFKSAGDAAVRTVTPWSDLSDPPGPLEFSASGSGEVTIAAVLDFVPAKLLPFPVYRGIEVSVSVRNTSPQDQEPAGPPVNVVGLAAVTEVSVQVTTPDALDASTLIVLLPGGLEPLDARLDAAAASAGPGCISPYLWYWPTNCPEQLVAPSNVTYLFDRIPAGTHSFAFLAVAASAGNWTLPPAQAYVTEQPEVMGLSVGSDFFVCSGRECTAEMKAVAAAAMPDATVPKPCPGDCNRAGVCNTREGTCVCDAGFSGASCEEYVEA